MLNLFFKILLVIGCLASCSHNKKFYKKRNPASDKAIVTGAELIECRYGNQYLVLEYKKPNEFFSIDDLWKKPHSHVELSGGKEVYISGDHYKGETKYVTSIDLIESQGKTLGGTYMNSDEILINIVSTENINNKLVRYRALWSKEKKAYIGVVKTQMSFEALECRIVNKL
jgi:hypothetical protein